MAAQQLALDFADRPAAARSRPVIERLRAVLQLHGINWRYRHKGGGSVLLRPLLAARSPWEPLCGFYGCGDVTFARSAYCDRPDLDRDEREAWAKWQTLVYRESVHELWGAP